MQKSRRMIGFLFIAMIGLLIGRASMAAEAADGPLLDEAFTPADGGGDQAPLPAGWKSSKLGVEGDAKLVRDEQRGWVARIESKAYTSPKTGTTGGVRIVHALPPAVPGSQLNISAWIKGKEIVRGKKSYFKLRLSIYAFNASGKMFHHSDPVILDGTFDWQEVKRGFRVPAETASLQIAYQLTDCTGTAWIDDLKVTVGRGPFTMTQVKKAVEQGKGILALIPNPWLVQDSGRRTALGTIETKLPAGETRLETAVQKFTASAAKTANADRNRSTQVIFSDMADADAQAALAAHFPGHNGEELGDQGYLLSVTENTATVTVLIAANSEQGRFYGLQTLKQLIDGQGRLAAVQILDRPTLSQRGIAMGLHWFNERGQAVKRMAALKYNFIWNEGTFLSRAFGGNFFGKDHYRQREATVWRKPLTARQLETMRKYLEDCRANFIEPTINMSPRGEPSTEYGSDDDINAVVNKFDQLYQVGFRQFGINFDDMQNIGQDRLLLPSDIRRFEGDIGKAHLYFVGRIYERLKARHPDTRFYFMPLYYHATSLSESQRQYLRTLGQLPKEIPFIGDFHTNKMVAEIKALTGHTPFIWDNYFARWQKEKVTPVFLPPLPDNRPRMDDGKIAGFMNIPPIPRDADKGNVSWLNSADYQWAPSRYDPAQSFARSVHYTVGPEMNIDDLNTFMRAVQSQEYYKPNVKEDSAKIQREAIQAQITGLRQLADRLVSQAPSEFGTYLEQQSHRRIQDLGSLDRRLAGQSWPMKVPPAPEGFDLNQADHDSAWAGAARLDGFLKLGGDEPAKVQTHAWLYYQPQRLLVRIVCEEPNLAELHQKRTKRDDTVFTDDDVELFLDVKAARRAYYHLAINPIGTVWDAIEGVGIGRGARPDQWNGQYDLRTKAGSGQWTVTLAIPVEQLGIEALRPGMVWNFNIARTRYAGGSREWSTFSPLLQNDLNQPSLYWKLEFTK